MNLTTPFITMLIIMLSGMVGAVLAMQQEATSLRQLWDKCSREGEMALLHEHPDEALKMYRRALEYAGKLKSNELTVKSLVAVGNTCRITGDYDAAERCFRKAIKLVASTQEGLRDRLDIGDAKFGLACLQLAHGEPLKASNLFSSACTTYRHAIKSDNALEADRAKQGLARSLCGLMLCDSSSQIEGRNGSLMKEALAAANEPGLEWLCSQIEHDDPGCLALPATPQNEDPELWSCRFRALQLLKQHDYEEAIEIFSVAIERARQAKNWRLEMLCMRDLATVYMLSMDVFKSESLYKDALAVAEANKDWKSADEIITSMQHLLDFNKEYSKLSDLRLHHAFICKQLYGPNDKRVGQEITHAAIAAKLAGQIGKSEATFKQALAVYKQSTNADVSSINLAKGGLLIVSIRQGDYSEALKQAEEDLAKDEKNAMSENDPKLLRSLYTLAEFCLADKHTDRAEALYKRGLAISKMPGGAYDYRLLNELGIADCLARKRNFAIAEKSYNDLLPELSEVFGKRSKQLVRAYDGLVAICVDRSRWQDAEKLISTRFAIATTARTESEQISRIASLKQMIRVLQQQKKSADEYKRALAEASDDLDYRRRNVFTYKVLNSKLRDLNEEQLPDHTTSGVK